MLSPMVLGGINQSNQSVLFPKMANRHGLIAGATGTGKTISLQVLAEQFSNIGVPTFMVDVKGDLSGLAALGREHPKVTERIEIIGLQNHSFQKFPTQFWDIFGEEGTSVRTTVEEMGYLLLAHLLELNETQTGVLNIAFVAARDHKLPLLDLKDLKATLSWLVDNKNEIKQKYGSVSTQSVSAIHRRLLSLSEEGGDIFFNEPALDIAEFLREADDGRGYINILSGKKLILRPKVYSTFLLWLLSELFTKLEEVGDQEKPKLVFFFDEAHLLFDNAPKALLERIEQVVRLIRSKGVGIYFITQSPSDIPDDVLGQLGNRIQHALRAFTPKDQKAVRIAAQTFRPNPPLDVEQVITELGVGVALISVLNEDGVPTPVEVVTMSPPQSQIGPIPAVIKQELIKNSSMNNKYSVTLDRDSAHEILARKHFQQEKTPEAKAKPRSRSNRQGFFEAFGKSILRSLGSQMGRRLVKVLIGLIGGKKR